MVWIKRFAVSIIIIIIFFSSNATNGVPSGGVYPPNFTRRGGEWYDSWGFNRNFYGGNDGYMPNVAYESIGPDKELAYSYGEWFKTNYPSKVQKAVAILKYVQRWTDYGYDVDNVYMNGVPQNEWAWNADEMAHMLNETMNSIAIGDCEDLAFLCSTIYLAADIDAAMVLAPQHVALLIWLPEYENANYYWNIPDDGRGYGWIWVEATGEHNPLGWTPPDFADGEWTAYPLGFIEFNVNHSPEYPQAEDDVVVKASIVSARASISEVLLNYSIGNVYNELEMEPEGAEYEAVIPKQPEGTKVTFYVSATDNAGFARKYKSEYIVGQKFQIPPLLIEFALLIIVIIIVIALLARLKSV